jgi:hypothetical protein
MAVESLAEVIELVEDELHVGVLHGTERALSSSGEVGVSSDGGRIQSEIEGSEAVVGSAK